MATGELTLTCGVIHTESDQMLIHPLIEEVCGGGC